MPRPVEFHTHSFLTVVHEGWGSPAPASYQWQLYAFRQLQAVLAPLWTGIHQNHHRTRFIIHRALAGHVPSSSWPPCTAGTPPDANTRDAGLIAFQPDRWPDYAPG